MIIAILALFMFVAWIGCIYDNVAAEDERQRRVAEEWARQRDREDCQ